MLSQAFPFHLVIDQYGEIISCGQSLDQKLKLSNNDAVHIFDHFTIQHPSGIHEISQLVNVKDKLFLLNSNSYEDLVLRGQLVVGIDERHFVFLISPWVTDVDLLEKLGFSLNDFPVHSPISDFLILVQAQRVSLNESMRLSDELTVMNKESEDRVMRRTRSLELKAQELQDSKTVLEREMKERERVEIELRHAQKLETVGQLAAGIAHEINTPMQYIGSSLEFLKESFCDLESLNVILSNYLAQDSIQKDEKHIELLQFINEIDLDYFCERGPKALTRSLDGIARVTEIVGAMNEFTHPDRKEMNSADINRALGTVITVASNEYKYVAEIETNFEDLPLVDCYLGDLNQVFLNLIVNAAHAISENNVENGVVKICTRVCNDSVIVSITDNGTGIPKHIEHRIFDPFFTTKEVGRGTGQGLSISHRIITEKHSGRLSFETVPDVGTTFSIALPIKNMSIQDVSIKPDNGRDIAA